MHLPADDAAPALLLVSFQDVGQLDACASMKEVYPSLLAVLHP